MPIILPYPCKMIISQSWPRRRPTCPSIGATTTSGAITGWPCNCGELCRAGRSEPPSGPSAGNSSSISRPSHPIGLRGRKVPGVPSNLFIQCARTVASWASGVGLRQQPDRLLWFEGGPGRASSSRTQANGEPAPLGKREDQAFASFSQEPARTAASVRLRTPSIRMRAAT